MIFPSHIFLLAFLPLVLAGWYTIRPVRVRLAWLVAASYVFYGWWDYRFVLLMLATTLLDYQCGHRVHRATDPRRRRRWLFISIAGNLGSLGFFKYYNFFTDSVANLLGASFPVLDVVLPLGISFYTFQSMSYTIDIYRGRCEPTADLWRFLAYVSMFPQLIAGPIVRYEHIDQQLRSLSARRTPPELIADGVWLFTIGLVKKLWIADLLAPTAELVFDQTASPQLVTAWAGTLAYTFQLYFDFSAYSDMARGLGLMLGFEFPINFNSPYKSADISQFWNRWHITLSHWLRDYLYFPLGGSRGTGARTLRNLALTMFLGGLWHGAAWNFVVWGLYHGGLLMVHACWERITPLRLPRIAAVPLTFTAVMFGWALFRANSLSGAVDMVSGLLGLNGLEPFVDISHTFGWSVPAVYHQLGGLRSAAFLFGAALIAWIGPNSEQLPKPRHPVFGIALAGTALYAITGLMDESPFLYFGF